MNKFLMMMRDGGRGGVRLYRHAAWVICGLAIATSAGAQVRSDVATQVMQTSGLWAQLGSVSSAVQSYLLSALDADPRGDAARRRDVLPVSQALQKAFAPDRLRQSAMHSLSRSLSPDEAQQLLAWYGTDMGRQISGIESQSAPGSGDPGTMLRDGAARLAELSPERRALLQAVLAGTHAAEVQTEVLIQSLQAIHRGTMAFMPAAAKVSPKDLRQRLEAQRSELLSGFQNAGMSLASGYYAALSDGQLEAYRDFLGSPLGVRAQALQQEAFNKALREAVDDAGRQLAAGASPTSSLKPASTPPQPDPQTPLPLR